MAEELNSNAKENLPIRQNLVDIAVGFLVNPNVKPKPDDTKIAFLKQKGLTDTEIDVAFSKVQYESGTVVVSGQVDHSVNPYPLPPYQMYNSFLYQLRSYSSAFVSLAAAIYIVHRFYKLYIEPWLFGSKSEMSEIAALKEQLMELNSSVSRLSSKVSSLEEAVNNQIHQIGQTSLYGVESVPKSGVILDELSSLKGLIVNRYNYPPVPPVGATTEGSKVAPKGVSIPKWQLRDSELDKSKVDLKEQTDESKDQEKSSSEQSSLDNTLSSAEDQTQAQDHDLIIAKDKIQEESKVVSENYMDVLEDRNENSKDYSEDSMSLPKNIWHEDSKKVVEVQLKDASGKTSDEDSGVELHNSKSTDPTKVRSGSPESSE